LSDDCGGIAMLDGYGGGFPGRRLISIGTCGDQASRLVRPHTDVELIQR
jgi:hypothetical protein